MHSLRFCIHQHRWLSPHFPLRFSTNQTILIPSQRALLSTTQTHQQEPQQQHKPNQDQQQQQQQQQQKHDQKEHIKLSMADRDKIGRYQLLCASVVPRPIALVSTIDLRTGIRNLAPFSFFNAVTSEPPTIMISITYKKDGSMKDTLRNILAGTRNRFSEPNTAIQREETEDDDDNNNNNNNHNNKAQEGGFVVNHVTENIMKQVYATSFEFPPEVDEFTAVGFEAVPSHAIRAPRVRLSPIQMECRLFDTMTVGKKGQHGSAVIVVGEVLNVHVDPRYYDIEHDQMLSRNIPTVSRLGGLDYGGADFKFAIDSSEWNTSHW